WALTRPGCWKASCFRSTGRPSTCPALKRCYWRCARSCRRSRTPSYSAAAISTRLRNQQNEASGCRNLRLGQVPRHALSAGIIQIDAISVPILVLGRDLIVACFNQAAADALSLVATDIGRSAQAISILGGLHDLPTWCTDVIGTNVPTQHDVRIADKSFIVRIAPHA